MSILTQVRNSAARIVTGAPQSLRRLVRDRGGNSGIMFALIAVPAIVAVGASLDFARAYNVQSKM